jgi:hypothetical protein
MGLQGNRVPFRPGFPGDWAQPGDYCKVPPGVHPNSEGKCIWYAVDPTGVALAITPDHHQVEEHEDGTITVTPSIVSPASGYHGFLRRGTWT